eukprot:TRINITY_DN78616_c0_g1_i1.p1 TRINITY_DN78616_c0_g1~~TRINITY_DN78616_c0_g1_i1.p1  ORF type:complete len:699 (+),score=160.89 TRINITY_DN78616_c0_g1_i1:189-2099(+)
MQRHQEDLQRCSESWSSRFRLQSSESEAGWCSASSEVPVGVAFAGRFDGTAPKLPPPPKATTPVACSEDALARIAEEKLRVTGSTNDGSNDLNESPSSTRTSSREQNARIFGRSQLESEVLPAVAAPADFRPPSAPCGAWMEPLKPADLRPSGLRPGSLGRRARVQPDDELSDPGEMAAVLQPFDGRGESSRGSRPSPSRSQTQALFSPLSKKTMGSLGSSSAFLVRLTRSSAYELASTLLIVLNAVLVIWETERRAALAQAQASGADVKREEVYFRIVACWFCAIFIADLGLRMIGERLHFFQSREWRWNVFDMFVALSAAAEVIVDFHSSADQTATASQLSHFLRKFSMLRILRLLRAIRTMRSVRVMRFIRELRIMVLSLTGSLKSLAWAVVLLAIVLLVFSVFFTEGAVAYCERHRGEKSEEVEQLLQYFGTVSTATVSLFMAMSGGEDWGNIMKSLDPLPLEYRLLFLVFITFAVLALLNVVTAVFVGAAMQQAQADREMVVQEEIHHKGELVNLMQQVFNELDMNGSGALSLEEFEKHIEDDKILAYLRVLEIEVSQVKILFTLLDVDNTGEVDIDEFVGGCIRLRGGATSMDLAVLKYQVEWILRNLRDVRQAICDGQPLCQTLPRDGW